MIVDKKNIKEYNKLRVSANKSIICHAPFQSINFTQNGDATVCCYNRKHKLGVYPKNSLNEIWFGKNAKELRAYILKNDFSHGCEICALQINSKNYAAVHARHYDFQSNHPVKHFFKQIKNYLKKRAFVAYPRVIEFELSNTCNLECVMCNGYFSSSIRKNREKLPSARMVYDDNFVEQLREFIPYLTDVKFLGGEPFLIPIYFNIWENIIALNPQCKFHITTNATIINERSWEILNRVKSNIVVSVDSMNEENYNLIRKGAYWKDVYVNIQKLKKYTKKVGTDLNFSVCPMTINWKEMPEIIQYGIDQNIYIYFNTVISPDELSLKNISQILAKEIIEYYEHFSFNGDGFYKEYNIRQLKGLSSMIQFWNHI